MDDLLNEMKRNWQEEDDRVKNFLEHFPVWIGTIPIGMHPIIRALLQDFHYYPHTVVNDALSNLHQRLVKENNLSYDDTIYTHIEKRYGVANSSIDYWVEYRHINKLEDKSCINNLRKLSEDQMKAIDNIVIIDDCIGTGKSVMDYIGHHSQELENKNIYLIIIHAMSDALVEICRYAQEHGFKIAIYYLIVQDKAFKCDSLKDLPDSKLSFEKLSEDKGIKKKYILGYGDSEALFAFYNNTPNNTLGLFWYDTQQNKSLFSRRREENPAWMNAEKKKRNEQKYQNRVLGKTKYDI